jgi:hypothetical protein
MPGCHQTGGIRLGASSAPGRAGGVAPEAAVFRPPDVGTRYSTWVVDAVKVLHRSLVWHNLAKVELHGTPELVPVEALRSGDPITDVHGGGQHYTVLESKAVGESCVVLELESKANDQLRVIEMSFPAGYHMGRSPRRIL